VGKPSAALFHLSQNHVTSVTLAGSKGRVFKILLRRREMYSSGLYRLSAGWVWIEAVGYLIWIGAPQLLTCSKPDSH
jgi:hypothetical protein